MGPLIAIAALAAQTAAPPGSAEPSESSGKQSPKGSYTYVDLEAGAGYSSNPNFQLGDNTGAGFGRLSVHGVHTRVSERTSTSLSAFGQTTFFSRDYGTQASMNVSARHDARVSETLRVFADGSVSYDEGGQLDTRILSVPDVPLPPGTTEPIFVPQTGDFVSVTGKQFNAMGHLGAQLALSPRDSLMGSAGAEHSTFKSGGVKNHYNVIPLSIGYDRLLSEHLSVGASLGAKFTDYSGGFDTTIISPQLNAHTSLSEHVTLDGSIGVSFSEVDNGITTEHSTGVAGRITLCSEGERSHLCAYGSVDQEAATVAGPARTITAGMDYSLKLDANQTLQFSVSGNHYSTPHSLLPVQSTSDANYFRVAADYTRHLGNRWFAGANVSARKDVLRGQADPKADVSGSLFVRYRLGNIQ